MPGGVRLAAVALVTVALAAGWGAHASGAVVRPAAVSDSPRPGPPTAYHAGAAPGGVAIADLDGDGHPDVAVTLGDENRVAVLLGRGDGTLQPATSYPTGGQGPIAVAVGDVNGDGRPDLVVANAQGAQGGGTVAVLLGLAGGGFAAAQTFSTVSSGTAGANPLALVLADADGDGVLDVLTADGTSGDVSFLHGNGDGTFAAATTVAAGTAPDAIATAVSGGTRLLAVADSQKNVQSGPDPSAGGAVTVLRVAPPLVPGVGAPTFTQTSVVGVGAQPTGVAFTDLDGDGEPDLVTADGGSDDVAVAAGQGAGTFGTAVLHPVARMPVAVAVADVDGDGRPDVLALAESGAAVSVLSGPAFTTRYDAPTQATPLGLATGDLDGDGRPDVVVSSFGASTVDVLLTRTPPPAAAAAPVATAAATTSPAPRASPVARPAAGAASAPAVAPTAVPTAVPTVTPTAAGTAPTSRPTTAANPPADPARVGTARAARGAAPPHTAARAYEDQLLGPTDTTAVAIVRDGLLALLLLALFQVPTSLVNETLKDNAAVIAQWSTRARGFGTRAASLVQHERLPLPLAVAAYAVVASVVYAFVEPSFRFDLSSLALVVGLLGALLLTTVTKVGPIALSLRRAGVRVRPRLFPAYVVLAAGCVAVSRTTGLHPGIVVGAFIGLAASRETDRRLEGRSVASAMGTVLVVTVATWFVRASLVSAVGPPQSFRAAALGVALTTVVVAGVELLAIGTLPLRFFDGPRLLAWSRTAWALFALVGVFLFVHVLVRPGAESGGPTVRIWPLVAFFLAYLSIAFAFWAWFRFRVPQHTVIDLREPPVRPRPTPGVAEPEDESLPVLVD